MADNSTSNQQTTEPVQSQPVVVATSNQPVQDVKTDTNSLTSVATSATSTASNVVGAAGQTAGAALQGATQAAAQAQQTVNQVGAQAQQVASQATQAAAQVSEQAQQFANQAGQTAAAAQSLAKDLFMIKAGQPKVAMEDKIAAFFAYMPLVCFLVLLLRPKSDYIALHGRQGMVLTGVFFLSILIIIVPFIGALLSSLMLFAWFLVSVYSAYQALIGNWWKIPVIGDLAAQIPVSYFATAANEAITGQISGQPAEGQAVTEVKKEEAQTPVVNQDQSQVQPPNQLPPNA